MGSLCCFLYSRFQLIKCHNAVAIESQQTSHDKKIHSSFRRLFWDRWLYIFVTNYSEDNSDFRGTVCSGGADPPATPAAHTQGERDSSGIDGPAKAAPVPGWKRELSLHGATAALPCVPTLLPPCFGFCLQLEQVKLVWILKLTLLNQL